MRDFRLASTGWPAGEVYRPMLAKLQIAVDPYGHLTYSGTVTATGQVNSWLFGWRSVGTVDAGIDNNEIWFSVDGIRVDIWL